VNSTPVRQIQPFGAGFRGGVSVATADIGTFSGRTMTSSNPDGITELVFGSGPGTRATVKVYNGVPNPPALVNQFNPISPTYNRGVSVSRLPSVTTGNADKILVAAGSNGGSLVETYAGTSRSRGVPTAAGQTSSPPRSTRTRSSVSRGNSVGRTA
jgi:hypothetical protein